MSEKVDKDTKEHYRDNQNHDNDDDNVPVTVNNQDDDDEDSESEREKNSVHSSDEDDVDVPDSSELESVREYLAAKLGIRDLKFLDDNQRHPQVRFT